MTDFQTRRSDFVNVYISTPNSPASFNEKKFPKDIRISDLKVKLEFMTGFNCSTMQIEVYLNNNKIISNLSNNSALLGSYPIDDGMRLHVFDTTSTHDQFDFRDVQKYEMPQEEYSKRTDTVRHYLIKNKMGQYNKNYAQGQQKKLEEEQKLAETAIIGSRCKVLISRTPEKLGVVLYGGQVEGLKGYWIGVQYNEPLGKNNGSFNGKQYFTCPANYGAFVKPQNVFYDDFPDEKHDFGEEI